MGGRGFVPLSSSRKRPDVLTCTTSPFQRTSESRKKESGVNRSAGEQNLPCPMRLGKTLAVVVGPKQLSTRPYRGQPDPLKRTPPVIPANVSGFLSLHHWRGWGSTRRWKFLRREWTTRVNGHPKTVVLEVRNRVDCRRGAVQPAKKVKAHITRWLHLARQGESAEGEIAGADDWPPSQIDPSPRPWGVRRKCHSTTARVGQLCPTRVSDSSAQSFPVSA